MCVPCRATHASRRADGSEQAGGQAGAGRCVCHAGPHVQVSRHMGVGGRAGRHGQTLCGVCKQNQKAKKIKTKNDAPLCPEERLVLSSDQRRHGGRAGVWVSCGQIGVRRRGRWASGWADRGGGRQAGMRTCGDFPPSMWEINAICCEYFCMLT